MADTPVWPAYTVGPRDSIFAIGVASIKYAELESVLHFMFATTFDLESEAATMIASKIGVEGAAQLIKQQLPNIQWSDLTQDLVAHFIKALNICSENRNHLMHSNLAWTGTTDTVLFKTTKQGAMHRAVPTLSELRRVADDMNVLCTYGRQLANSIQNSKFEVPIFPVSAFPMPDKPSLPHSLEYTPDMSPIPLTRPSN